MIMGWGAAVAKLLDIINWLLRRKKKTKRIEGGHTPKQSLSGTFEAVQPGFMICAALSRALQRIPRLSRVLLAYCHDGGQPLTLTESMYTTILCEQHAPDVGSAVSLFEPRKVVSPFKRDTLADMVRDNKDQPVIVIPENMDSSDIGKTYYTANGVSAALLRPVFVAEDQTSMYFLSFHFGGNEGEPWKDPVAEQAMVDCVSEVVLLVPRIMEHA